MNLRIQNDLLFTKASLVYSGKQLNYLNVLIDTGSAGTLFPIDKLEEIGIQPDPDDPVRELRGIGGTEFVFIKKLDIVSLGNFEIANFQIEIGAMDYGFEIDGIIGLDFLLQAKAKIDLKRLEIY